MRRIRLRTDRIRAKRLAFRLKIRSDTWGKKLDANRSPGADQREEDLADFYCSGASRHRRIENFSTDRAAKKRLCPRLWTDLWTIAAKSEIR